MFFSIMHVYCISTEVSILLYSSITHCVKSPHCIILLSQAVVRRTSYIHCSCLHSAFRKHHGLKSSDKSCSTARKYVDITPKTRVRHALFPSQASFQKMSSLYSKIKQYPLAAQLDIWPPHYSPRLHLFW